MNDFDSELAETLSALREGGLHRQLRRVDSPQSPNLRMEGRPLLNFSSNDYLGLANHPALREAAMRAIKDFGAGSGASRLVCGSLAPYHELDESLAAFKGTQAALSFATGYAAVVGAITALLGREDVIVIDRLVHASVVDAARLCGAKLRVFPHNDLASLEDILERSNRRAGTPPANGAVPAPRIKHRRQRTLIVTESVFSMDGDAAPLREIADLKDKYGAWLMVDEAHATGLYGPRRRGLAEALGVSDRIEIQMGTLGKAIGASGGCICGSRALIDCLVNTARTFIFSTAPVPAAAAAAAAGLRLVQSETGDERLKLLWQRVAELKTNTAFPSAIIPIIIGDESETVRAAASLREVGILIPAIRFPSVARGKARLRLTVSASHTAADVVQVASALRQHPGAQFCPF